jgi:hypothetical protein
MHRRLICLATATLIAVPIALLARGNSVLDEAPSEGPSVQIKKTPAPYTSPSSGKTMYADGSRFGLCLRDANFQVVDCVPGLIDGDHASQVTRMAFTS